MKNKFFETLEDSGLKKFEGQIHMENELVETLVQTDENHEGIDSEEMFNKLQSALCYAYDIYLREKKGGEHCPTIEIGDYLFAALGFTCGHVDFLKVFKKIEKRKLLLKKTKYVSVKIDLDIVNLLAKEGGLLPPMNYEILEKM